LDIRKKFFYNKSGEEMEEVAQRGGGYPAFGDIQDQAGPSSELPDLAVELPVRSRGVGLSVF